jgi:hypothetical protein
LRFAIKENHRPPAILVPHPKITGGGKLLFCFQVAHVQESAGRPRAIGSSSDSFTGSGEN